MAKPFLRQLLEEQTAALSGQTFLTFGDRSYSYAETDRQSNRFAQVLLEMGVRSFDRVAFLLPNCPEFIFGWIATIKLNLTLIPLNTQLKGEALAYIIRHSAPHLLITDRHLLPEVQAVAGALPNDCRLLVLDMQENSHRVYSFDKMFAAAPPQRPLDVPIGEEDPALIIYTSGTTGHPKGVVIGRRAQTNHPLYYHKEMLQTAPGEVAYCYLPLFHVTAQGTTMGSLLGGSQVALDTGFKVFGFWERLRRNRAVVFPYLGAVLQMLYTRPETPGDAENPVRRAFGAAAPAEIWASFERRFNLKLVETYGQSEWMAIWVMQPPGATRIGAAGKAPERAEVKIVDESGRELPPGRLGQIIMRPKEPGLMMSGYYRQPELNARVFNDGWYYTGDAGELDGEGYLYFRGRLKDYIRRRGENISAFEIEQVVNGHPAVMESAAVGVPSELSEEEVKLCVVLKPEAEVGEEALWEFCNQHLPRFMVPRYIQILPELPRTATQRVRKFMLATGGVDSAWDRKTAKRTAEYQAEKNT
ncbi:MAG TPA: AMP-binding protein [Chloroflexia bacterium]|nr:AMP-binding protein [Chloroflexia bacterium]